MKTSQKHKPLSYKDFVNAIAKGTDIGHTVFFYGGELYLIDQAVRIFIDSRLDEASREYGQVRMDGDDTNWAELENALTSTQMFAPQKIVLLHNPSRLPASSRKAMKEYLLKPRENIWLCMVDPQVDWRKQPFKDWAELLTRIQCDPLPGNELTDWIKQTVEAEGLQVEQEQIGFLQSISDGDMQIISGILEKIFLLVEKGEAITEELLENATGSSRRYSWDTLLSAIAKRDFQSLWHVIDFLYNQAPTPTYFTQILSRTFQGALLAQQFRGDIPFDMDIYKSIGYFGQARNLINSIAKAYTKQEIVDALNTIRTTDRELKNSSKSTLPMIHHLLTKIVFSEKNQEPIGVL